MVSQIFKAPGFYQREIDLTSEEQAPVGIPAGVAGGAERGVAFVPKTVGSFEDFKTKFGNLNPRYVAPYAVDKHLEYRPALTFLRILGAGGNITADDIGTTQAQGTVRNAGFTISSSLTPIPGIGSATGAVQFLIARHIITGSEAFAQAGFSNNNSLFTTGSTDEAMLVRGVIFCASGTHIQVLNHDESWSATVDDAATADSTNRKFKIVISSSAGSNFFSSDGYVGVKILTASLDPENDDYFTKILNTDPERFSTDLHVVYSDFVVDSQIAVLGTGSGDVVIASGSSNTSTLSGDTSLPFLNAFGKYDTRFRTPASPVFISQPFGTTEFDLFYIEALDDGVYANKKYKISIANLQKSANPRDEYGSFTLLVRDFADTDAAPRILEQFPNLSLNPESENYICRKIGDKKAYYNFDVENEVDRRIITSGKYSNLSKLIRVVPTTTMEQKKIPALALPFGFRGPETPSFNSKLIDRSGSLATSFNSIRRMYGNLGSSGANSELLAALVPPLPLRFKVTRGSISTTAGQLEGAAGALEITDARYYWGIKFEKIKSVLNPNPTEEANKLVSSLTQFNGLDKLDVVVTGSANKDKLHNNKFTLARVTLGNGALADLTSSAGVHMKETCYLRNGKPDVTDYKINDSNGTARITFASLLNKGSSSAVFNAYSNYAKFSTILQGGYDGVNILDKNAATFNDRATSTEARSADSTYGNVHASFTSPGFDYNQNGTGITNNTVASYRSAVDIITDAMVTNINVLAIPGQRDPLVTDYASDKIRDYSLAIFLMDIPNYDNSSNRLFDGESGQTTGYYVDPNITKNTFEARAIDNADVATYFPDVIMDDNVNTRRVIAPASVAAVAALSFNDKVSFPWFAPAGFNRASLDFVELTTTRVNQPEREALFAAHVNSIVKFPGEGYVIFSQNTLEQAETALGSINVQRLMVSLKRQIINIGNRLIWEQVTPELYAQLRTQIQPILSTTQIRKGIKSFEIICDERNNTDADRDANKINCKIVLVPIRAVEFISVDFIIQKSGVQFV